MLVEIQSLCWDPVPILFDYLVVLTNNIFLLGTKKNSLVKAKEKCTLKTCALEMVFCYQNCSDLLLEKKCSSDREKLLKFEAIIYQEAPRQIQKISGQKSRNISVGILDETDFP